MRLNAVFIALLVLAGLVVGSVVPRSALCGACDCGVELVVEAAAADACCGGPLDHDTDGRTDHEDQNRGGGDCECVRCIAPAVKAPASSAASVAVDLPRGMVVMVECERPAAVCGDGLMDPPKV